MAQLKQSGVAPPALFQPACVEYVSMRRCVAVLSLVNAPPSAVRETVGLALALDLECRKHGLR